LIFNYTLHFIQRDLKATGLCSEHRNLLTDILKEEWRHEGLVVADWGATNDRIQGLIAGLELEMPASNGINDKK